jgi:hypothetical protein
MIRSVELDCRGVWLQASPTLASNMSTNAPRHFDQAMGWVSLLMPAGKSSGCRRRVFREIPGEDPVRAAPVDSSLGIGWSKHAAESGFVEKAARGRRAESGTNEAPAEFAPFLHLGSTVIHPFPREQEAAPPTRHLATISPLAWPRVVTQLFEEK